MLKDLFSLKGRVALVTGGSRGIGKMIAAGFLSQGAAKVYITARKAGPCEATAKELTAAHDGECIALPIDISTMAGIEMLAAEIKKREPKLDILVNNAGAAWGADFDEFPESGWDKVMNLNLKTPFFLTKALAAPLARRRDRCAARQGHQHRFHRRHLRQSDGDVFLCRQQVRPDPSDAANGGETDPRPHRGHGDRPGTVQVRHEQGGARQCR
jgi:NAD(P)-dependent dehydrogenase (short-subunit alcohol dehydrogenase family)